mgnify:FL=1
MAVPQSIKDLIKSEEGFRDDVYPDATGFSAGYGHLLSEEELKKYPPGSKVPQDQIDSWFEEDVQKSYNAAVNQNNELSKPVDLGRLTSVNYQLGESWNNIDVNPKAFDKTWNLMKSGDYSGAAVEVLDSDWAKKQTPDRAKKFSDVLASMTDAQTPVSTDPTPTDPTPSTRSTPVAELFPVRREMSDLPSSLPASFGYTGPRGAVERRITDALFATQVAPALDPTVQRVAATTSGKFGDAFKAGVSTVKTDIQRFKGAFNLLTNDPEEAELALNLAEVHERHTADLLRGLYGSYYGFRVYRVGSASFR